MSGRKGKADLAGAANTDLYTVPANKVSTVSLCLVNRTNAEVAVRVAVRSGAANAAPTDAEYIEYGAKLAANGGVLERTQIVMSAGETLTVHASAVGVSARVHGFEEAA